MGRLRKKSVLTTVILYLGIFVAIINKLYFFPTFLSAKEIGLLELFLSTSLIFVPFLQLGTGPIISRFYPFYIEQKQNHYKFFTFILFLFFFSSIFFSVLYYSNLDFFGERLAFTKEAKTYKYLFLLIPLGLIISINSLINIVLTFYSRFVIQNILNSIYLRISSLIIILIYSVNGINYYQLVYSHLVVYFIQTIVLLYELNTKTDFEFKLVKLEVDFLKEIKDVFYYGLFSFSTTASNTIIKTLDFIMVTKVTEDLTQTGVYTISYFIGTVVELPKRALNQVIVPSLSIAMKTNKIDEIKRLYTLSSLNQFIIGAVVFSCIAINTKLIYHIIPNGKLYAEGLYVLILIGSAKVIDMFWGVNAEIIGLSKYYKWNLILAILLTITTIYTNNYFISIYGMKGAAMATFLTIFIYNNIRGLIVYYYFKIIPFSKNHFYFILILISCWLINWLIPNLGNIWIDSIVRTSFALLILVGITFKMSISNHFNEIIRGITSKLLKH